MNINQSNTLYFAYTVEIHNVGLPPLISLNAIINIYTSFLIGSLKESGNKHIFINQTKVNDL